MKEESSSQSLNRQLFETYVALDNWHKFRLRLFIEGIFVGIFGGLCISLFRFLLGEAETFRIFIYNAFLLPATAKENFLPLALWAAALVVTGFLLYAMDRYAPMAGGSGIPQVKGVILGLYKMKWIRILWVKIIAGAMGIGAGLSLGREGPSIQIGAVAGQGISRFLGRTRMEERYLITSGASAGLAAAFNAPLAGMMFALEELHRNFSGAVLLPTMTSAITATIVTRFFFGNSTSFHFINLVPMPADHLGLVVLIAISAGFAGILFNYGLLHTGAFYNLPVFKNQYVKILFALFSACLLGFFLPLLVIGALLGSVEANVLSALGLINEVFAPNIIIIGMVSLFAASVRSPITGTLLILEMTGDFGHLMALALGSAVAYITAELLKGEPIYDALLKKSLAAKPDKTCEEERNIVEVPVGSGSILEGKKIRDVPRVKNTIIIDLKRHGESVIPDPDIRLQAEDFLYILTASKNAETLKRLGEEQVPRESVRRKI